ncbi:MAG: DUF2029 domain-containing protein [Acidobacteria bacterium]|nr:MAG: DUF2029 domain-containing protein [Acidobacteriota bacterium]
MTSPRRAECSLCYTGRSLPEALLYLPLAYLSYATAYIIWIVLSILVLLLAVSLLWPYMTEFKAVSAPLPLLTLLAFVLMPLMLRK